MCAAAVPDDDHLSRYCRPSAVASDGLPMAAAFELRPGEDHLSVNWLEYFSAPDLEAAIESVRNTFRAKGFGLRRNGRFAALNVGAVKATVSRVTAGTARVVHLPVDDDESHGGVFGYTADDLAVAVAIRALVGRDNMYPAVAGHPPPPAGPPTPG